jgi:predicted secreted Zn-dependent protease
MLGLNTPQGCLIQKIDINGKVTTYSPFLLNPGSMDWANRFERLTASVKIHEAKHAQIYMSYWNALANELTQWENKIDTGHNCEQTMQKFTNRINLFNQQVAAENANLDKNEGHMSGDNVYRIMGY